MRLRRFLYGQAWGLPVYLVVGLATGLWPVAALFAAVTTVLAVKDWDAHQEERTETMKRKAIKADEQDVVTGWRRYLCYMKRAGVVSRIKRRMRRRERHDAKATIRREG